MQNNEMRVLKLFIEVFSPSHCGNIDNLSYNGLFDLVAEIVETQKNRRK